ncbi:hypothetical protein U1Q18_016446 [Sarracenia purpurea var. burkii]
MIKQNNKYQKLIQPVHKKSFIRLKRTTTIPPPPHKEVSGSQRMVQLEEVLDVSPELSPVLTPGHPLHWQCWPSGIRL